MQKLTRLSFEEQNNRLMNQRDIEWVNISGDSDAKGASLGSAHISAFLKIGDNYVSRLLDMLFDAEEKALSSANAPIIEENYFTDLTNVLIRLMQAEYKSIRDRAFMRFEMMPKDARTALRLDIDQLISQKSTSIIQRADALREKLKLRLPKPTSRVPIRSGAALVDTEALYSSVHAKIRKSIQSENIKFLETLDLVLGEIYRSPIDEKSKLFRMQTVDFLIDQYNAPEEQKNPGLINASLYYLASAANEAGIWSQFGPVIVAYFNKFM